MAQESQSRTPEAPVASLNGAAPPDTPAPPPHDAPERAKPPACREATVDSLWCLGVKWARRALLLAVTLFGLVVLWNALTPRTTVLIEPFAVPDDLQKQGYTPAVVGEMLQDQIRQAQEAGQSKLDSPALKQNVKDALPDVEVPDVKVSLGALLAYVRGWRASRVQGTVFATGHQLRLTLRYLPGPDDPTPPHVITVPDTLPRDGRPRPDSRLGRDGSAQALDDMMRQAALLYLEHRNPYLTACVFYHRRSSDPHRAAADRNRTWSLIRKCLADAVPDNDAWALSLAGSLLTDAGKFAGAEEKFREAVRVAQARRQQFALPLYNWGNLRFLQGRYAEATELYSQATHPGKSGGLGDPKFAEAYRDWGAAVWAEAQRANSPALARQSLALLAHASRLKPRDALAHMDQGVILDALGDADGARRQSDLALECDPTMPDACILAGRLAENGGRLADARDWYKRALSLRPRDPAAKNNLARLRPAPSSPKTKGTTP